MNHNEEGVPTSVKKVKSDRMKFEIENVLRTNFVSKGHIRRTPNGFSRDSTDTTSLTLKS